MASEFGVPTVGHREARFVGDAVGSQHDDRLVARHWVRGEVGDEPLEQLDGGRAPGGARPRDRRADERRHRRLRAHRDGERLVGGDLAGLAQREELDPHVETGRRRVRDEGVQGRAQVGPLVEEVHREALIDPEDEIDRHLLRLAPKRAACGVASSGAAVAPCQHSRLGRPAGASAVSVAFSSAAPAAVGAGPAPRPGSTRLRRCRCPGSRQWRSSRTPRAAQRFRQSRWCGARSFSWSRSSAATDGAAAAIGECADAPHARVRLASACTRRAFEVLVACPARARARVRPTAPVAHSPARRADARARRAGGRCAADRRRHLRVADVAPRAASAADRPSAAVAQVAALRAHRGVGRAGGRRTAD